MTTKTINEELQKKILEEIKHKSIANQVCGGSYYDSGNEWYDVGGGNGWYGIPGTENSYLIPEVICTPNGNHINYNSSEYFSALLQGYAYGNYWNGYDEAGGSGSDGYTYTGGNGANSSWFAHASQLQNSLVSSVENNTAICLTQTQSGDWGLGQQAISTLLGYAGLYSDVLSFLGKSGEVLSHLGRLGAVSGTVSAIVGITDGEITDSDIVNCISAAAGLAGIACYACPVAAITLDGISIIVGIAASYIEVQENQVHIYN